MTASLESKVMLLEPNNQIIASDEVARNLRNYELAQATFSWEQARMDLTDYLVVEA